MITNPANFPLDRCRIYISISDQQFVFTDCSNNIDCFSIKFNLVKNYDAFRKSLEKENIGGFVSNLVIREGGKGDFYIYIEKRRIVEFYKFLFDNNFYICLSAGPTDVLTISYNSIEYRIQFSFENKGISVSLELWVERKILDVAKLYNIWLDPEFIKKLETYALFFERKMLIDKDIPCNTIYDNILTVDEKLPAKFVEWS